MADQTEAQRLADEICDYSRRGHESEDAAKIRRMNSHSKAAAELRRLNAVNKQLLEALEMGYADTMDYIKRNHLSGAENNHWIVAARAAIAAAKGEA
jgi:hypothetical protein